ncbi:anti-sigma factor [Maribrevibacterium harenarium]|uniref:Anti-sigma factor n=1 Tax=Maribrevibacterium harenarium TaxID=2589817 RepID=A0A501WCN6_9GAMM|nr:cupin domain-containing protein [Maribrevibacterium harenarium]TPE47349.1 anti-sigma factor [Maribrevibacterium harenarium]
MRLNADFSLPAIIRVDEHQWVASPQAGVERMMLDRVGEEKARATSLVRYVAGSSFPPHPHPGGEEILVLDGTFCDATGEFPAGTYIRNPPDSVHSPYCPDGATIFVKLRQMSDTETEFVRIDTNNPDNWQTVTPEHQMCLLYADQQEQVSLQSLAAGAAYMLTSNMLAELLILQGEIVYAGTSYGPGSWIRLPVGHEKCFTTATSSARFYQKLCRE